MPTYETILINNIQSRVCSFDRQDLENLKQLYANWLNLSKSNKDLGGRSINTPDVLSEAIFCIYKKVYRVSNGGSFDAFDPNTNRRIQIKATSIQNDLTSFGPKSVWDDLYFMSFYADGNWDGTIDIYKIDSNLIYQPWFIKQQQEGRRPRFSIISSIVAPNNLQPDRFNLFNL